MSNTLFPCDKGIIQGAWRPGKCSGGNWVLVASILGSTMAFLDANAVNVALPAIQTGLKATATDLQWVVEGYTLFLGALLLVGGSLGDRFGQRKIFGLGVILFTLASIWCGLAISIQQLLLARGAQGLGAALLVPSSLALISVSFSEKELGRAIGVWSGMTSITAAAGPVLGGVLAQHASWRWVFFLNVPLALGALIVLALRVVDEGKPADSSPIDWRGAALTVVGLGGIVYGFLQSSPLAGIVGLLALIGFGFLEGRERSPMLPLSLFKSLDFTGACVLTLFLYGALASAFYFLPLNLVQVQGYSESAAGAALLPFILLVATLSRWSGGLLNRFSGRTLLTVGPLITAFGFALLAVPSIGGSYWTTFFPAALVLGFGMAITVAPLTTTVMNSLGKDRAGIASGVNNAVSRVGGLLAVALFGVVLASAFNHQLDARLDSAGVPQSRRSSIDRSKLAAAAISGPESIAVKEAFVSGFRLVFILSAGATAAGALGSWLLIGRRPTAK